MGTRLSIAQLSATPGATFDEPFEMLAACHERVERTLRLLERLRAHVQRHGADASAREAASDVLRYFDLAAPHHHLDEEIHLFPVLEQQQDPATARLVAQLRQEHAALLSQWAVARLAVQRLADGEQQRFSDEEDALLETLASLHREHLRTEDALAYPRAAALMPIPSLQAMGLEMQQRRQQAAAPKKTPGAGPGE